jgi:thermitase
LKKIVLLTSATVALATMVGCGTTPTANFAGNQTGAFAAQAKAGELVVRFKSAQGRQALLQNLGLKTVGKVNRLDAVVVKGGDKTTLAKLQADSNVLYAEPNYVAKAITAENFAPTFGTFAGTRAEDELLAKLWGMTKIQASEAWKISTGDRKVKVAVVDTGIDYNHPDLAGRVDKGYDFINNDNDAMDDQMHGTHCAGTVAAGIGNGGVVGVAPNVSLVAIKVLSKSGSGDYAGVANGIIFAADSGAEVISMSLGGGSTAKVLEDAVKYAQSKGALIVAAMGNDNSERPGYPASLPGVLAVGATTSADIRSSFSTYGKHISVGAPGSDILSTLMGGGYKSISGTSMATPHVAGLAALVKSVFPNADAAELRSRIEKGADDLGDKGFDKYFGHGRINALKSLTK